ncbi:MAG: DUF1800 family protein, partial [Pyrinomonadaceae bacterium]|nr:DUF1800 family protein [Pyrinomonadaceae bacterium]
MKRTTSYIQRFFAAASLAALLAPAFILRADARSTTKPLSDEQKIMHVLNRLGFGARPGDVQKVKALGIQKYIDQQLNPATIDDPVAELKVKNLEIFNLSTSELFAKYPNPGALLQQLEGGRNNQANANQAQGE